MINYQKLLFWQRSQAFVSTIYRETANFPRDELFGLTSQLRRAVVSIPTNIAEGSGRDSKKDFAHFLRIAIGSACEVECELLIARDLGFIDNSQSQLLLNEIKEIKSVIDSYKNKLLNE
ncbi:MAG: four helix bundle protein [Muribaculaceae bacterium]|nr:four helix bundle protein [Muribaculaceae bacterium]